VVDFTQPCYEPGLQILVSGGGNSSLTSIWQMIKNLFILQLPDGFLHHHHDREFPQRRN
jgi:hypothetical protein